MRAKIVIGLLLFMSFNQSPAQSKVSSIEIQHNTTISVQDKFLLQAKKTKLHKVIDYMQTKVNRTPYIFSGSTTSGWDCSGLVRYAYKRIGIILPHSADAQGHLGKRVSKPQLGDIVVFAYPNQTRFYHAALYLQNGLVLEANSFFGTTVIQPLKNYKNKQIRFIRILDGS